MNTTAPFKPLVSTAERQRVFGLFDVLPNLALYYQVYKNVAYSILSGKLTAKTIFLGCLIKSLSNFFDGFDFKPRSVDSFTSIGTAFLISIVRVLSRRRAEKMLWIYTKRCIAFVADKLVFWDVAIKQFIGKAVSAVGSTVDGYAPVAICEFRACPYKAFTLFVDRCPKSKLMKSGYRFFHETSI
jgi:hypothetical protein